MITNSNKIMRLMEMLAVFSFVCETSCRRDFLTLANSVNKFDGTSDPRCKRVGQFLEDPLSMCHYLVCNYGAKARGLTKLPVLTMRMPCAPGTRVESGFVDSDSSSPGAPCTMPDERCTGDLIPDGKSLPKMSFSIMKKTPLGSHSHHRLFPLMKTLWTAVNSEMGKFRQVARKNLVGGMKHLDKDWRHVKRDMREMVSLLSATHDTDRGKSVVSMTPAQVRQVRHKTLLVFFKLMVLNDKLRILLEQRGGKAPEGRSGRRGHVRRRGDSKMGRLGEAGGRRGEGDMGGGYDGQLSMHQSTDLFMMRVLMDALRLGGGKEPYEKEQLGYGDNALSVLSSSKVLRQESAKASRELGLDEHENQDADTFYGSMPGGTGSFLFPFDESTVGDGEHKQFLLGNHGDFPVESIGKDAFDTASMINSGKVSLDYKGGNSFETKKFREAVREFNNFKIPTHKKNVREKHYGSPKHFKPPTSSKPFNYHSKKAPLDTFRKSKVKEVGGPPKIYKGKPPGFRAWNTPGMDNKISRYSNAPKSHGFPKYTRNQGKSPPQVHHRPNNLRDKDYKFVRQPVSHRQGYGEHIYRNAKDPATASGRKTYLTDSKGRRYHPVHDNRNGSATLSTNLLKLKRESLDGAFRDSMTEERNEFYKQNMAFPDFGASKGYKEMQMKDVRILRDGHHGSPDHRWFDLQMPSSDAPEKGPSYREANLADLYSTLFDSLLSTDLRETGGGGYE